MKITISVLLGLLGFPSSAALLAVKILWAAPLHVERGLQWMEGFALTKALLMALQWGIFYTTTPPLSLLYPICFVKHYIHNVWGHRAGTQQLLLINNLEFMM